MSLAEVLHVVCLPFHEFLSSSFFFFLVVWPPRKADFFNRNFKICVILIGYPTLKKNIVLQSLTQSFLFTSEVYIFKFDSNKSNFDAAAFCLECKNNRSGLLIFNCLWGKSN